MPNPLPDSTPDEPDSTVEPGNTNTNTNTNTNSNTKTLEELPQAEKKDSKDAIVLGILLLVIAITGKYLYGKLKKTQ